MNRGCPAKFIAILIYWFDNITTVVKWGNKRPLPVKLTTGIRVRLGSILSPLFVGVFINNLLTKLSDFGLGCHIKFTPFNVFMFANDLLIVAHSIRS